MIRLFGTCLCLSIVFFGGVLPAAASCRDEIPILKTRLTSADRKAANVAKAKQELNKAEENVKNETACANSLARAWQAYRTKPLVIPAAEQ